jgi:hypothetical protein
VMTRSIDDVDASAAVAVAVAAAAAAARRGLAAPRCATVTPCCYERGDLAIASFVSFRCC